MLEQILREIFAAYGFWALALVLIACMGGTMAAQMVSIKRFAVSTASIADSLGEVVGKLDLQRAACALHYDYVRDQSEALKAVAQELRGLVEAVHESDKARAQELMQVILELTRRTSQPT